MVSIHIKITAIAIALITLSSTQGCASPAAHRSIEASGSSVKYGKGLNRLGHAIQMGAFSDVHNAERFTTRLQAKGIEAFYFRKDNGIYAVRFGDFPSREKARVAAQRLVNDGLIDGFYIAPPNEVVFKTVKGRDTGYPATPSYQASKPAEVTKPGGSASKPNGERDMGFIAARTAERFIGIPYQWGGDTVVDGMDCSGFARAVYNLCGVNIPRTSKEQYKAGSPVGKGELRDGDLVFFGNSESSINHVGIYVGNGKFVHAPKRGEDIKTASIEDSYFERRFVGARRYFQ